MKKRIQLFLIRWYEASDKPLPQWLERACDDDLVLGLELDEERDLTRELKSKPKRESLEPNPDLANRIMRSLDERETPDASPVPWKEISFGIAACVAIALAIQFVNNPSESGETLIVENAPTVESKEVLLSAPEFLANVNDWKNPLDQEIEYVMEDAKGALDFLAESFLPSSVLNPEQNGDTPVLN